MEPERIHVPARPATAPAIAAWRRGGPTLIPAVDGTVLLTAGRFSDASTRPGRAAWVMRGDAPHQPPGCHRAQNGYHDVIGDFPSLTSAIVLVCGW